MPDRFKQIGLIGKYADPSSSDMLRVVSDFLKARNLPILLDKMTASVGPNHSLDTISHRYLGEQCDLVILIGGDGTMLNAVRTLSDYDVAICGINLGRLGFLTDISPNRIEEELDAILQGRYNEEERFLLHCSILRDDQNVNENSAFNDVVVHKKDVARMIEVDTYINGTFVNTVNADGLIVSTPTGSTAYALSGGGPILQPCLEAVALVPICPHTMSNRPIVVDASNTIEIVIKGSRNSQAQVTCDGQINFSLMEGDRLLIRRKESTVRLIHPINHDYFHILREKLGWG